MKPGNIIFVYLVDGSQVIGTYLREDRGFFLFEEDGNVIGLRSSSINTVVDTGRKAEDVKPLNLKDKKEEEDEPTEIIPVKSSPNLSVPSRGRLHL